MKDKLPGIAEEKVTFLEGIPGAVEEDVGHPSMVRSAKREAVPVYGRFRTTEDAVNDNESGFQIRVFNLVVVLGDDLVSFRDGPEDGLIGFATDALALGGEVNESLGAEVSLVPELGDDQRVSG